MRYLFLTNTPAHVHLYKHVVPELRDRGHDVRILARDYGPTVDLLEYYDLPYRSYGRAGTSKRSLARNLPVHCARIPVLARQFAPDLVFGMGGYAALAAASTRSPAVLVVDSEPTDYDHALSRPFARTILTPAAFRKDLGSDHHVFQGFKECAYLHPEVYEGDPAAAREDLGLDPGDPYVVVRFNAFGSHHDVAHGGFDRDQRRRLIRELSEEATVVVSDEGGEMDVEDLPAHEFDLHPALMHDALAGADLLVADSQTMVTEAALLGTPAVRSNSFVGDDDMGNFVELGQRELVYNCPTFEEALDRALSVLHDSGEWERRHRAYVPDLVNLRDVLVDVATAGGDPGGVEGIPPRDANEDGPDQDQDGRRGPGDRESRAVQR